MTGAKFWRSVCLSGMATVYVMTVSSRTNRKAQSTLLLARDLDVVDALESMDANLVSLLCLVPAYPEMTSMDAIAISEVWTGVDLSDGEQRGLFIDDRGVQRSGALLLPNEGVAQERLIARIGGGQSARASYM